jgi:hypothetical protein
MLIGSKMLLVDVAEMAVAISFGVVDSIGAITMPWSVRTAPKINAPHSQ